MMADDQVVPAGGLLAGLLTCVVPAPAAARQPRLSALLDSPRAPEIYVVSAKFWNSHQILLLICGRFRGSYTQKTTMQGRFALP